jgi:AbrB family looped-hinge helix DNA binding protein
LRAATTRVSSKGQVVIPEAVKKAAGVRKGDDLLVVAMGDTILILSATEVGRFMLPP